MATFYSLKQPLSRSSIGIRANLGPEFTTKLSIVSISATIIGDVIDELKIGRTAFYRYFPPDRIKELRNEHQWRVQF